MLLDSLSLKNTKKLTAYATIKVPQHNGGRS